jgi:hypothetical protein
MHKETEGSKMKILVACEFSGTVRDAFAAKGHDAWSCDILPTESPGNHYQCDLFEVIDKDWDLIIAHPPCTYLTVTGNRWFKPEYKDRFPTRQQDREDAVNFFMKIANNKCPKIAIENPVGVMSRIYRKPDQIIQPYQFGHDESKKTCLWLKGLPLLKPTNIVEPYIIKHKSGKTSSRWHFESLKLPPHERMKARSKTFPGIANAMAEQWS